MHPIKCAGGWDRSGDFHRMNAPLEPRPDQDPECYQVSKRLFHGSFLNESPTGGLHGLEGPLLSQHTAPQKRWMRNKTKST